MTLARRRKRRGLPQYMSPEQADGRPLDHRSDLFSLGSVIYAMCTGRAPFRSTSTVATLKRVCEETPRPIRELNPDMPDWLEAIIAKLHAKNPEERFQSAKEVGEFLEQHLAHLQISGRMQLPPIATIVAPKDDVATHAHRLLRWPAMGLGATGILYWITIPVLFVAAFSGAVTDEVFEYLWLRLGLMPAITGCILIFAAWKMRQAEFYWLCVLAACLPFALLAEKLNTLQSHKLTMALGDFTALPFGMWALITLTRRDVRMAFHRFAHRPMRGPSTVMKNRRPWRWIVLASGILLILVFLGTNSYVHRLRIVGYFSNTGHIEFENYVDPTEAVVSRPRVRILRNDDLQEIANIDLERERLIRLPPGDYRFVLGEGTKWRAQGTVYLDFNPSFLSLRRGEHHKVALVTGRVKLPDTQNEKDLSHSAKLQGAWKLTGGEIGGWKLTEPFIPSNLNLTMNFAGDQAHLQWIPPKENIAMLESMKMQWKNLERKGVFHLDAQANPKRMTIFIPNNNKDSMLGIYRLEQDRLTLCFGNNPKEIKYPTEFATKKGDGLLLLEFRRVPATSNDEQRLQGAWRAVEGERQKKPISDEELRQFRLVFEGSKLRATFAAGAGGDGTVTINPTTDPKQITVKSITEGDRAMERIYRFAGERLVICMGGFADPRPAKFATDAAQPRLAVVTLARIPALPPKPRDPVRPFTVFQGFRL